MENSIRTILKTVSEAENKWRPLLEQVYSLLLHFRAQVIFFVCWTKEDILRTCIETTLQWRTYQRRGKLGMRKKIRKKDEIARKRQELLASRENMSSVNKAMDCLRKISITFHENNGTKRKFTRRPELSDFYQPSTEMKHYQNLTMGVVGLASGLAIGFLV